MTFVFWFVIAIPLFFVMAPYVKKGIDFLNIMHYRHKLSGQMPHRIMDDLMYWEEGDTVVIKETGVYQDEGEDRAYYKGVTDDKEIVFSSRRSYDDLSKIEIPEFLGRFEFENTSLKDRRESEESIEKELEESNYMEFLRETRKALEDVEERWRDDLLEEEIDGEIEVSGDVSNENSNYTKSKNKV